MAAKVWHQHYDTGIPTELEFEPMGVADFLGRSAKNFPGATAVQFMNANWTYAQLEDMVQRMASAMQSLGVRPKTRVAIQLPNLPQAVAAFYAALRCGAHVVMTNPLYTPREIEHQWNDANCELAVTADFIYDQKLRKIRDKLPVKNYIIASIPDYLRFPLNLLAPLKLKKQDPPLYAKFGPEPGVHRFKDLIAQHKPQQSPVPTDMDDIAVLQYTGGTTGPSKGAMLTQANLSYNVQQISAWFPDLEPGNEVILIALPLFHVFGLSVGMNWAASSAAKMVLMPNPRDFKALVKNISKHRVTVFPGVPALFNGLNNFDGIEGIDVSSVKSCFSGSAPIPPDVLQRFEKLTSSRIIEGFGMSETSPVTHVNPLKGQRKIGSVGVPLPNTDSKVVSIDDGVTEMPIGEEGELIVRGPQVMQGYWNRPEETAGALRDGWMHTGDLAVVDEQGYFKIVGRMKDMINCGGLKVFPDEVDSVLMAHDKILEAATIGVPDPKRGETVKSFIVLQPGASMDEKEVEAYSRENLAAYKIPRQVEFLDALPKSSVMKVLRRELRDRELKKNG